MVGPVYAKRLKKLGIETVEDFFYHFPHRYHDFSIISKINRVQPGEVITIQGKIQTIKNQYTKRGRRLQKATISDNTASIEVLWFNQPFLVRTLKKGATVNLSGKVDWFGRKKVLISPEYEIIKPKTKDQRPKTIHTGRLVPVYPETYGVSSKWLRSRIFPLLSNYSHLLKDWLPEKIKKEHRLINLREAIKAIHFPEDKSDAKIAKERLAFEEMFLIHLTSLVRKRDWQRKRLAHQLYVEQEKIIEFIASLPFKLTNAQNRCVKEILDDLSNNLPMNRLLEGDVGSGKTVVATIAMYAVYLNGLQSSLMAPTEILANQHYQTIKTLLEPYGVKIEIITGSQRPKNKDQKPDILIGTHALIYKHARFDSLGLVVIDEQHRFGVEQRAKLVKKGKAPHILTMTATPIPRTVALTLYGDLDLSVIDEMPPGRIKIKTWVVPPQKREAGYRWIEEQIKKDKVQAFIICPLIEESEKEKMKDVRAATAEYERLKKVFIGSKLGLLHGRLKSKEKEKVIDGFRNAKIDILVATPVVEVGIDVPKATIMLIEASDRFGLAQLHQLRGRVGRRNLPSYCFLFTESHSRKAFKRLKYLEKTNIGMELAEYDLKLRGPGELLGTKQHGFPDLRAASFTDLILIKKTRKAAEAIIDDLKDYPALKKKLESYII
jgi:ATP-dependent DNA helicase RecG